ncbi:MAG: hypothetical protein KAJ46_05030, partial [Sedimentisphaerales bacterium]|nr:hypothetical protein [Sedimentisphaerales bacterium]
ILTYGVALLLLLFDIDGKTRSRWSLSEMTESRDWGKILTYGIVIAVMPPCCFFIRNKCNLAHKRCDTSHPT